MGEYIKFKGEETKIGTCENLYYTTYEKYVNALKSGQLSNVGSTAPEEYVVPDSGFRFRFPFPDEDKLPLGQILEPYNRGISITIEQAAIPDPGLPGSHYQVEIVQQKLIHRQSDKRLCLALVCRDPVKNTSFRIEDDHDIKAILRQIVRNHVADEQTPAKKNFYRQIALRILKGYRIDVPAKSLTARPKQPLIKLPYKKTKRTKGKDYKQYRKARKK